VKITCWGARGSIPVCGPEYVGYGGDTCCVEVRGAGDEPIIIDAGTGIRRLGAQLLKQGPVKAHLIFTHAHWDHISGFRFFEPVYHETTNLKVICWTFAPYDVTEILGHTMAAPYFPVSLTELKSEITYPKVSDEAFDLGGLNVASIPLSHPNGGMGYKFSQDGSSFVFLTDNELGFPHPNRVSTEKYLEFCQGADLLVHDAEYTPEEYEKVKGYGHSTYTEALDLALRAGVKRFALFHHNRDRTDQQIDNLVADCRARVGASGSDMEVLAMAVGLTLQI